MPDRPNILFVFGDQWRRPALGCTGNRQVRTPHIDAFADQAVDVRHATSGTPVCGPARATLMTGQYPLTHGVFVNDVPVTSDAVFLGEAFRDAGYETGWIGKWHIDGHGRAAWIPPDRHRGFEYWKVLECTHDYHDSRYYAGDDPTPRTWPGYDAIAQTDDACRWLRERGQDLIERFGFETDERGDPVYHA